ncbi:HAMP domain-containing sensor histidine kinase [Streptomyces sp. AK08-02]|uniref:sensor histidine kinase n=1 Tax=Streptomyces sp. AK08-02 TaxID=3028654 RepID=UPI0029B2CC0D|nr:HAMP domain-containing sensor histidine kinase [Streptomyces sp. AK08-02]MDX3749481.1 HAMP domain-containing sensor histidine kinase [Streptomyces sp. AK08-02]
MSFRLRVLGLLMLVALAATAATGWLTLRQANRQVQETVTAGRQEVARITGELRTYGFTHGTWDGLSPTVAELARDTGQRIRVATESDVLLTDSDALAGRTPRALSGQPAVLVDARPALKLPAGQGHRASMKQVSVAIAAYRAEVAYAACLTRAGAEVTVRADGLGIPRYSADRRPARCPAPGAAGGPLDPADLNAVNSCDAQQQFAACIQRVFDDRVGPAAPPRLQVHLGVRNESAPTLAAAPTVAVAAGVALAVVAVALLLSRAVLRPVRAMTVAAKGLGEGDLGRRVPVSGRDEIAQLGGAFNRMADSIQAGEERQRRLTGDIAHELRTPLANLRGYLEALRDGVVEPTPELLESLHREALLQQRIVDDLQDLALAEAGALTYHPTDVDLRGVLEAARRAHLAQAEAAGVALRVDAPTSVHVTADTDRLRQVVGNLVGNALRATPVGGSVTLAVAPRGELAVVEVRDTGKGIAAEDLPHLFDRFWRADVSRGRATGGSGLGLSIARQIVTDHRGKIDVRSEVGTGTTFTIVLPRSAGQAGVSPRPGGG